MFFSKKKIQIEYTNIKRNFQDSEFVLKVTGLLFILTLVIFVIGAIPLYKNIQTKKELEKQLLDINSQLLQNKEELTRIQGTVLAQKNLLDNLSVYMPYTSASEEYITQLSYAVSSAGFILRHIGVSSVSTPVESGVVLLSVKVDGPGDPIDLLREIEQLKRITKIKDFYYKRNTHSSVKKDSDVTLSLEIYTAGGSVK